MKVSDNRVLNLPDQSLGLSNGNPFRMTRVRPELQRSESGCMLMNDHNLKLLCEQEGLYEYPQMNKKLYLHFKTIKTIENLNEYTNLLSLYLQNNVISQINNLDALKRLQNLFLQNNMIKRIEGLTQLKALKVLNLSNNTIFKIEGLSELRMLQSLTLSRNYLSDFDSVEHLGQCATTLTSIDLTDNKIVSDERFFDLIPQVKCLYMMGNPLVREVSYYRRTFVAKLKELMYLDQRRVESEEHMLAQAWLTNGEGGYRAAQEQLHKFRSENRMEQKRELMKNIDYHRRNRVNIFQSNIEEAEADIRNLRAQISSCKDTQTKYFYEGRISELQGKIKENQEFIVGLYRRMGLPSPVFIQDVETNGTSEGTQSDHGSVQGNLNELLSGRNSYDQLD